MNIIIFLVIAIVVYLFLTVIYKAGNSNIFKIESNGYKKRDRLLNGSEEALFLELKKEVPSNLYVFPNMRLADIVDAVNGRGFYKRRNKILPRHVDFIICDSEFKPLLAIELNGNSHLNIDRIEMDKEKKNILDEAGIPLEVIKVGDNFSEVVKKIVANLSK